MGGWGATPLAGVLGFNFIMNRDVFWMLCLCGAICGGAACVWYWSGSDGESVAERRPVAGRGGRGGGGEAESGGNNQTTKNMNDSIEVFPAEGSVLSRIYKIESRLRHRLGEYSGADGSYVRKNGVAGLEKVISLISREEWVFLCVMELTGQVTGYGGFRDCVWQGYELRPYLREIGLADWGELFEKLYPLELRRDEIEGQRQDKIITEDECIVLVGHILVEMETMVDEAGIHDFDLPDQLLLDYAIKHGFADVAVPDRTEEGRRE